MEVGAYLRSNKQSSERKVVLVGIMGLGIDTGGGICEDELSRLSCTQLYL